MVGVSMTEFSECICSCGSSIDHSFVRQRIPCIIMCPFNIMYNFVLSKYAEQL